MYTHDLESLRQAQKVCEMVQENETARFLEPEFLGKFLADVQVSGVAIKVVADAMEKEIAADYEQGAILDAKLEEYHKELAV